LFIISKKRIIIIISTPYNIHLKNDKRPVTLNGTGLFINKTWIYEVVLTGHLLVKSGKNLKL